MSDPTIKQALADKGIEVRKTAEGPTRELWRAGVFLGHYSASRACAAFLAGAA